MDQNSTSLPPAPSASDVAYIAGLAKEERKFLHDVASPLATLNLVLETVLMKAEAAGVAADLVERLKKARTQVERINTLLRDRREILIKRSDPPPSN